HYSLAANRRSIETTVCESRLKVGSSAERHPACIVSSAPEAERERRKAVPARCPAVRHASAGPPAARPGPTVQPAERQPLAEPSPELASPASPAAGRRTASALLPRAAGPPQAVLQAAPPRDATARQRQ